MKYMTALGLSFFLLNAAVAAAGPEDIDPSEKDLGRGEAFSSEAITAKDVDAGEKDIGKGELSRKEDGVRKDVDPKAKDLGKGEPFIKTAPKQREEVPPREPDFSVGASDQTGAAEILKGSDFTDVILEGSVSKKPFLKSLKLLKESEDDDDENGFHPGG